MISNQVKAYLLFIEPAQSASATPLIDELTRKMAAAFRAAKPSAEAWLGIHDCVCGAGSMNHNYILPDGRTTNSLCVHYLAHHRAEVPIEQLREVEQLDCGQLEPTERELSGLKTVQWDELAPEQREALEKRMRELSTYSRPENPQAEPPSASTVTSTENWASILYRWLGGAVLCFFALAPAWIAAHLLLQAIAKPLEADLVGVAILTVCVALTYFLLLLAYRAFRGRGRKQDDGLLPPWAMKGCIHAFGVVAVCILAFGIYEGQLRAVLGGTAYLLIAYGALYAYGRRPRA